MLQRRHPVGSSTGIQEDEGEIMALLPNGHDDLVHREPRKQRPDEILLQPTIQPAQSVIIIAPTVRPASNNLVVRGLPTMNPPGVGFTIDVMREDQTPQWMQDVAQSQRRIVQDGISDL
jgi:hypothetical protein